MPDNTNSRQANNLVAQSDYQAALDGLEKLPDNTKPRQANNLVAQSDYQAALDGLEKFYSTQENKNGLAEASYASLAHNLRRVVQPISDKDFHDHVDQYHYVQEEEEGRDDKANDHRKCVVEEEEVHDGYNLMEDQEYESEDLLDPQALEEAQKLREQVRQLALRVQKRRDAVLQRAQRMWNSANNNSDVDVRPSFVIPEELRAPPMPTNMQTLMKVLNHSQLTDLPKKMQLFQATLDTIQKETKEDRSLSQTEAAILAREEQTEDAGELFVEPTISETPQDRLANFLLMQD